jgi:hypothetical protein
MRCTSHSEHRCRLPRYYRIAASPNASTQRGQHSAHGRGTTCRTDIPPPPTVAHSHRHHYLTSERWSVPTISTSDHHQRVAARVSVPTDGGALIDTLVEVTRLTFARATERAEQSSIVYCTGQTGLSHCVTVNAIGTLQERRRAGRCSWRWSFDAITATVAGLGTISTSPTYPVALNLPLGAATDLEREPG